MTGLFDRIMEGLGEALEHAQGQEVVGMVVHIPEHIDVSAVRERSGLTQTAFAARIGVRVGTLRNWEQKRRGPDGPARVLLAMIERNPRIVEETLGQGATHRRAPTDSGRLGSQIGQSRTSPERQG